MKVALVGAGYWGSKLLRNLVGLVGVDNVVVVDNHLDRLGAIYADHPSIRCCTDLESALDDASVGAVVIATPVETHFQLAEQALLAGRHCLVEKPLTTSVGEAQELVELARRQDRQLMVGHTFLFSPRVRWIAGYLQQGRLGKLHYVTSSRLNLGLYRSDANVIWDLAPHDFSIIFHLLGEFPVSAQTSARDTLGTGRPDVAFIDLTFPSGTIASVAVSWMSPRKVRNVVLVGSSSMVAYDDTDSDEAVKVHDKGVVTAESADFGQHQLTYRYGDTIAPHIPADEPLRLELKHFLAQAATNSPCLSDGTFGLHVVAALQAADLSHMNGGIPMSVEAADLLPA